MRLFLLSVTVLFMSLIEWPLIRYLLTSIHPGCGVFFFVWRGVFLSKDVNQNNSQPTKINWKAALMTPLGPSPLKQGYSLLSCIFLKKKKEKGGGGGGWKSLSLNDL